LNRILFFSDNKELIAFWSSTLNELYQIGTVLDIRSDFTADLTLVDAEKLSHNHSLLSLFKEKSNRFLIIGDDWSEDNQIEALTHGAVGYCDKSEPAELLLLAIDRILKGDIWIQRHLVSRVIGSLVQMKPAPVDNNTKQKSAHSIKLLATLSNREREVAGMIRSGDSNKAIAGALFISERTVKAHLTSIFKKLKVSDRLHLALFIKEYN